MDLSFDVIDNIIQVQSKNIPYFTTPRFTNYLNEQKAAYASEENDKKQYVIAGRAFCIVTTITQLNKVWKDIPIDYYNVYSTFLRSFVNLTCFNEPEIANWFSENMSYRTFFNMMNRYLVKTSYTELNDTFSDTVKQLRDLIRKKATIIPPKRWRLIEFHDHVSEMLLEQTIDNVEYKNTISKPYKEGDYTVYQPKDKLDLAKWASKVRNCVLSRSSEVEQGSSEIVFVEKDGIPEITVEINGPKNRKDQQFIQIKEIKGRCNSIIPKEQEQQILKMIQSAMA